MLYKSGEIPGKGTYAEINIMGFPTGVRKVLDDDTDRLPPTQKPNYSWKKLY